MDDPKRRSLRHTLFARHGPISRETMLISSNIALFGWAGDKLSIAIVDIDEDSISRDLLRHAPPLIDSETESLDADWKGERNRSMHEFSERFLATKNVSVKRTWLRSALQGRSGIRSVPEAILRSECPRRFRDYARSIYKLVSLRSSLSFIIRRLVIVRDYR